MKWKKFTLKTTTEAVDYISSLFDEIGIQGIEIEDNVPLTESETKGMFIDILPELPPDDGTARVSFYLDDDDDAEAILKEVDEGLSELRQYVEIGEGTITASETEDKDWINNWKQYFKPFTVDHILIKPTWEEIPEEHKDKLLILEFLFDVLFYEIRIFSYKLNIKHFSSSEKLKFKLFKCFKLLCKLF